MSCVFHMDGWKQSITSQSHNDQASPLLNESTKLSTPSPPLLYWHGCTFIMCLTGSFLRQPANLRSPPIFLPPQVFWNSANSSALACIIESTHTFHWSSLYCRYSSFGKATNKTVSDSKQLIVVYFVIGIFLMNQNELTTWLQLILIILSYLEHE